MAISSSSEIIKIGGERCAIVEDILDDHTKERFKEIIDSEFSKGYNTSANIYFKEAIFDENINSFLNKYNIEDPKEISALIKYLDKDIIGHTMFLYKKDQEIRSIEDVIENKYDEYLYRNQIVETIEYYNYRSNMLNATIDKLLDEDRYVQLDIDMYLTKDKFKVNKEIGDGLLNYIEECLTKDGYFIPRDHVKEISNIFGRIDYEWNQFIIYSIVKDFGYKKLYRYNSSYDIEVLVLVKNSSSYDSIDELVLDILKKDYNYIMHESHILRFLENKGFYKKKDENIKKVLPRDLIYRDYIQVDAIGNVSLKE